MDMVTVSVIFGLAAGVTQLVGYLIYNWTANGKINTGSWSIWALGGGIDLVSYYAITDGDWVVNALPAACAAGAVLTFLHALARKRFEKPDVTDWVFVGLDGAITIVWTYTNAVTANLLYQASNISSFIPLVRGLLAGNEKEEPLPWMVWTLAYSLLSVSVILRYEIWEELAYPISHAIIHAVVYLIIVEKRRPTL